MTNEDLCTYCFKQTATHTLKNNENAKLCFACSQRRYEPEQVKELKLDSNPNPLWEH